MNAPGQGKYFNQLQVSNGGSRIFTAPFDRQAGAAILMTGICLGLSMPPYSLYMLAWVGLVPLLTRWESISSPQVAWVEASSSFLILYLVAGFWTLRHVLLTPALAALGGGLLLAVLHGIPFALATPFRKRGGRVYGWCALAAFSLTLEYLLLHGPLAFPWFLLGHTQADALAFNQFIDLTGVLGLSAWIWILNGLTWMLFRGRGLRRWAAVPILLTLIYLPYTYSQPKLNAGTTSAQMQPIAIVQPAIPALKWAEGPERERLSLLTHLSDSLLKASAIPPALLIWPETALPHYQDANLQRQLYRRVRHWTKERDLVLLTGAVTDLQTAPDPSVHRRLPGYPSYLNSALLFDGRRPIRQYDKRRLVPFAEQVPFAQHWVWLSSLSIASSGVSGYRSGRRSGLLTADSLQFAVQICFESLFGHLNRQEVQNGAAFLVVLAQDGWWGNSIGPYQHLALTRLRAIETRRAVVMASVSGISGLIYPDGTVRRQTDWMDRTSMLLHVPVRHATTIYVRYGDWPGLVALILSLLMGAAFVRRRFDL